MSVSASRYAYNRDMAETGPTERVPEARPEASEGSHVLVVDDDNRLSDLLRRFLGEHGYRVTTAGSAAEARAHLAGMSFDIMVVDVMMPGESGTELTQDARERLLGDPQDFQQLGNRYAGIAGDEINHPVMRPPKSVIGEDHVAFGGEIAIREEQQLHALIELVLAKEEGIVA